MAGGSNEVVRYAGQFSSPNGAFGNFVVRMRIPLYGVLEYKPRESLSS